MFKSYLKVALRNIWRNKVFSFINVFGLALGLACSLLIGLWVQDELRYNRFHARGGQLYRVLANLHWGDVATSENTPGPLAEVLKKEIPEIEYAIKMTNWDFGGIFTVGNTTGKEKRGRFASPDFFRMFSFPLTEGNLQSALHSPNSIVISQSLACKYFGKESPVGKTIRFHGEVDTDFLVTGVMQDVPQHSSIQFDYVIPFQFFEQKAAWAKTWGNYSFFTFVALRPDASRQRVEAKIKHLLGRQNKGVKDELFLQPFEDMYLYSNFENGRQAGGRIEYVRWFSVVAAFVLLIACINFMNLATARSARRAKEVGIRKVVGGTRTALVRQFMGESILTTLLAMTLSILLISLLLPAFNALTGKQITLSFELSFLPALLGVALLTGVVSGSYPALFLSALNPERVLKGVLRVGRGALLFRKGLVVFQFTLSILLIVGTLLVYRQIQYVKNKNLGLDRENVIALELEGDVLKHLEALEQEVSGLPGVQSVTTTNDNPTAVGGLSVDLQWPGKGADEVLKVAGLRVGYHFLRTLDIRLKEGRDFSRQFATDSTNYILNEAAVKAMRLKDPIGQEISFWQGKGKVIGVVKDFHQSSLHETIRPLVIMLLPKYNNLMLVKTQPGKTAEALSGLEQMYRSYNPQYPFEYHFLDETFGQQYRSEMLVGELAQYFAVLAVLISCLGLFGLAAFTAEQRTKEIGIRKVLGANVASLVALLSKEFIALVGIAFVLASPVAWYIASQWLQKFAYREEIAWWIFVLAGGLAVLIAVLTVGFQSIKAALANPVKSLRSE